MYCPSTHTHSLSIQPSDTALVGHPLLSEAGKSLSHDIHDVFMLLKNPHLPA